MNKLEKFNAFIGVLNVIVVGIILACVVIAMAGCATPAPRSIQAIERTCPKTQVEVGPPEAWTARDQIALDTATRRCAEWYPNSPCLKRFIRHEQGRYWAICTSEVIGAIIEV